MGGILAPKKTADTVTPADVRTKRQPPIQDAAAKDDPEDNANEDARARTIVPAGIEAFTDPNGATDVVAALDSNGAPLSDMAGFTPRILNKILN